MNSARRFFVEGARERGNVVEIAGSDAHKIARVLRLQPSDRIEVVDSAATAFDATIESVGSVVRAVLSEVSAPSAAATAPAVDVAQAVPKASRMEFVVEKCTELGAAAFLPFFSERSVARSVGAAKLARWRRIARTAAAQSGRHDVPHVCDPIDFATLLDRFAGYERVVFAWELAPKVSLAQRLQGALPARGRVLAVVGPEGGFSHDEADAAANRGAMLTSLGSRILRTDTAAIALLAVIDALAS